MKLEGQPNDTHFTPLDYNGQVLEFYSKDIREKRDFMVGLLGAYIVALLQPVRSTESGYSGVIFLFLGLPTLLSV